MAGLEDNRNDADTAAANDDAEVAPASGANIAASPYEEWQEFLKARSNIRILTIIYVHVRCGWRQFWIIYLLILVLAAELMLPIILLMHSLQMYERPNFCPLSADGVCKAVAFVMGCIYHVLMILMSESKSIEHAVEIKPGRRNSKWLRWVLFVDGVMNTSYKLVVCAINVFIVVVTPDNLIMVLYSMAFEFILLLDKFVKPTYIAIFSKNHDTIMNEYYATFERSTGKATTTTAFPTGIVMDSAVLVPILKNILPASTLIYLPWCKLGNTAYP
ncbi:hypothetical protein MHU86_22439 [Fragilaria crotonensis]|nr:hypothetical protein MHU86_22439 [Fragilaria crotonensis]